MKCDSVRCLGAAKTSMNVRTRACVRTHTHTPARATGGESPGFPPSHDCPTGGCSRSVARGSRHHEQTALWFWSASRGERATRGASQGFFRPNGVNSKPQSMQPHLRLIMECHDRADSDTSRGRGECLWVRHSPDECPTPSQKEAKLRTAQASTRQKQLTSGGVSRDDRVSNTSNDAERALRSYVQQFRRRRATVQQWQQAPPDPARTRTASRSVGSPALQREESDKTHTGSGYYTRRLESTKKELRQQPSRRSSR